MQFWKNPYKPVPVRIAEKWNEPHHNKFVNISLEFLNIEDRVGFKYLPGQFCLISDFGYGDIPMNIASSPFEGKEIFFVLNIEIEREREILSREEDAIFGIRGPLGKGYPLGKFEGRDIFIIGSGEHFPELRSLFWYLALDDERSKYGKITVVLDSNAPSLFSRKGQLPELSELSNIEINYSIESILSSDGECCDSALKLISHLVPDASKSAAAISLPLKAAKTITEHLIDIGFARENVFISLHRNIRCGVGKCGRCNVGHKFVCIDGPVFSALEIEGLVMDE